MKKTTNIRKDKYGYIVDSTIPYDVFGGDFLGRVVNFNNALIANKYGCNNGASRHDFAVMRRYLKWFAKDIL